ncbi:YcfL family protein [Undibacterium sp. Xuan67W]|uniref:YcfL family protein n=1 Tax=Undibacterium sp. Xuan67W TaxID=3413057 RepID=UPI003BF1F891
MTSPLRKIFIIAGLALAVQSAFAGDQVPAAISPGIAAKLMVRGELQGLQVVDLRSQRKNDVMVVQAEVTNTDVKDLRLYYRFRWTDAAGMQVGDGEVWKPMTFLGKQTQFIKSTAYGPQATDFKIEMSSEPR